MGRESTFVSPFSQRALVSASDSSCRSSLLNSSVSAVYLYAVSNFVDGKGSAVSVVDGATGGCYGQFLGNAGGDGFLIFRTMDDLQAEQPENDDRKEDDDAAEHNKYSVFTKI